MNTVAKDKADSTPAVVEKNVKSKNNESDNDSLVPLSKDPMFK
jgi:hypothetical protein